MPDPDTPDAAGGLRPASRARRVLLNLALAGVATLLTLAVAEVALRLVGLGGSSAAELATIHQYDSLLGWRNRPNSADSIATDEYRLIQRFNARGARGPERMIPKPRGVFRVLLLGDSFLEGYTVDDSAVVSAALERALARPGGPAVEVVNVGTAGYATDQEVLLYETDGRAYQPDVTVLLFYVNDVWYNVESRYWRGSKPRFVPDGAGLALTGVPVPRPDSSEYRFAVGGGRGVVGLVRRADAFLGEHVRLYQLTRSAVRGSPLLSGLAIRAGFAKVPDEFEPWRITPTAALAEAWRVTELLLARLDAGVRADGGRLVVFAVPARPAVLEDDWARTRRSYAMTDDAWSPRQDAVVLGEVCARRGLDCLLPLERFRAEASAGSRLYFRRDAHWTAEGHALAARLMAEHIGPWLRGTSR